MLIAELDADGLGRMVHVPEHPLAVKVDFSGATFSGKAKVDFSGAAFSGGKGKVDFVGAAFSGGEVDFSDARFSGGKVDFRPPATFFGGTVDFSQAKSWTHPPDFGPRFDVSHPPAGVRLPDVARISPDTSSRLASNSRRVCEITCGRDEESSARLNSRQLVNRCIQR